MKFNKFQNTIINRAKILTKHGFEPQMSFVGNKFVAMSISVFRYGRKAIHFIEFTKTSKSTSTAKSYYEFSDDRSSLVAPIPIEKNGRLFQIKNDSGIYKLHF